MAAAATPVVRGVLFDLDGTLVDSAPDLAGAANRLRADHGLEPLPLATLRPMVGSGARGMVFFSTLNRNAKAFLFAIVGAEHVLKLLPKGTHEYAKFIRPSELSGFARDAGLETLELVGMEYNPLTQRYWLSGDTSVNYMVVCRRPQA